MDHTQAIFFFIKLVEYIVSIIESRIKIIDVIVYNF